MRGREVSVVVMMMAALTAAAVRAEGQSVQYRSPAGIEYRSQPDTGAIARAEKELAADPRNVNRIIDLGVAQSGVRQFREAISTFSRGIVIAPGNAVLYRWRGHRYLSVREFDKAIADLKRAARLIAEKSIPDQVEPDGDPNPQNVPTSTSHFNIWYHLGLAYYLKGDFESAARAYRECMKYSEKSDDRLVATSDWLYMTLRRRGRKAEADAVLKPITPELKVIENAPYWNRLLMYKGRKTPEELLGPKDDPVDLATYGYGVGNWYLYTGQTDRAREVFQRVVAGPQWNAFGYIAAEVDLARMK